MRHIHSKIVICVALSATLSVSVDARANVNFDRYLVHVSDAITGVNNILDDIQITGKVSDEQGNPIVGATIIEKGTNNSTISDTDGKFVITANENATLIFSMKDFKTQEFALNGKSDVNVVMLADISTNRGVNIAFRNVSEEDLLGSISYVNVDETIKKNFTLGALGSMESMVGGWNGSTLWGMNPSNSSYFIVVDGIPRGLSGYENMISQEIEQVTFMKGADAVALYGSRGAKGAILITTKRGQVSEGLKIETRVNTGVYVAKCFPEYLSSAEYMTYYNQALIGDGLDPKYSEEEIYNYAMGNNPYRYPNIDYYSSDYIKKIRNRTDVGVELSGGTERARYYGNINYYTYNTFLNFGDAKKDRTHRYSVRGNVDVKITNAISAYINTNATFYDVNSAGSGDWWGAAEKNRPNRPTDVAPMIPIDKIDPNASAALDLLSTTHNIFDGKFLAGTQDESTTIFGDMYATGNSKYTIRKFQFDAGMNFKLNGLLEGLTFKTMLGMDFSTEYTTAFSNKYAVFIPEWANYNGEEYIVGLTKEGDDEKTGNQNISGSVDNRLVNVTGMFDYTRSFGQHNVNAILLASGSQETKSGSYHSDCSAHLGFHAGYNYAHRYYFDFNSALVHSIRLAEGHRNVFSPSATIGWNLANEEFLKGNSSVNKLLLTASASILHEDYDLVDGDNKYYLYEGVWDKSSWAFTWYDGSNATSISPKRGENYGLEMIKREEVSVGIKSAFFKNMITLDANAFINNMDGYLIQSGNDWPSHMIDFVPYRNNNIVQRTGFDFQFGVNKKVGEVGLSLGIVGTVYTTERTKYEETVKEEYQKQEGQPEDAIFGYRCLGIFQSQEEVDNYTNAKGMKVEQNLGAKQVSAGDLKYEDVNLDGKIDSDDQVYLGKYGSYGSPTSLGFNFTAEYKNFTLFITGTGYFGGKSMINNSYYWMEKDSKYSAIARECWSPTNTDAKYPRLTTENYANNYQISDFWLYDNNYFNLDRVQLTYNFPQSMLGNSFVKGLSVYVTGDNLLLISKQREYKEMTIGNSPDSRYYGIGVKATF